MSVQSIISRAYLPMDVGSAARLGAYGVAALFLVVVLNVLRQLLPRKRSEPPLVFHWIPLVGNAVSYGMDPLDFYQRCRKKVSARCPHSIHPPIHPATTSPLPQRSQF